MLTSFARLVSVLVTVAIALWLGSLVHLLISVQALFATFPKETSDVALQAAPALFHVSEHYHLGLAIVAIVGVIAWRYTGCSRPRRRLMWLLILGLTTAIVSTAFVTPRIDALRETGQRGTPAFRQWHGVSNVVYLGQLILVLTATALLPSAIRTSDDACGIRTPGESEPTVEG